MKIRMQRCGVDIPMNLERQTDREREREREREKKWEREILYRIG
jgi:hypothetical protein